MHERMNVEQLSAFEELQHAVEDDLWGSRLFFLEGAGGTGKTFLYKCLYFYLRSKGVKVKFLFVLKLGTAGPHGCTDWHCGHTSYQWNYRSSSIWRSAEYGAGCGIKFLFIYFFLGKRS